MKENTFKTPLVSIITPMYNGADFIAQTIDSVLRQSFENWEMIIADDCSPDGGAGAQIVSAYALKDPRVKLIRLAKNKGSSGARNEAMRRAKGSYLAFLDSDDIWHGDYLSTMISHINENTNPSAAIFFCGYRRMDDACDKEILSPYLRVGVCCFKQLLRHCPIFPSAAIVDKTKLKSPVFFREKLRSLRDDYVFWLDILSEGLLAQGYPEILCDYRIRGDSATASKTKMIYPQWNVYRDALGLNFFASLFYLFCWALNGLKKYKKSGR